MSYRVIEKQVLYTGKKCRFELHRLEDEEGRKTQREVVAHPGAVVVLPFLDDNTVLMIRNMRYTIGTILLELPAGTLEKNEDPINCAGRELQEETGYLAARLKPVGNFYSSPGILSEKMYAYAAYDLEKSTAAPEEGEEIEVVPMRFDDAIDGIRTGQIHDGKSIATLLMYDRFFRRK